MVSLLRRTIRRAGNLLVGASAWGLPKDQMDLAGDRDIEWAWVAAKLPLRAGNVLDLGPATSSTPLMAAYNATSVIGFDLNPVEVPFAAPNLTYVRGDILNGQLPAGPFDTIINCSTTEHIGLSGRYGNREDPDGDLTAMRLLREKLARPDGRMLFTIPVGIDGVYRPYHRVYGSERLPRILSGYEVVEEAYYAKTDGVNVWRPVSRERALAVQGSDRFYALGLFVLQAVHG
ncbi:MAG TPA: DUF268 domain-containing protein [bacterium]|nr:DUF268 domain-containing protein [bacterium]